MRTRITKGSNEFHCNEMYKVVVAIVVFKILTVSLKIDRRRDVQEAVTLYSPVQLLFFRCYRRWFCLLDAAAFVSTNVLNLGVYKPDFVAVSFHKIFGYPTGLGALIVKNTSAYVLKKSYYGGGTVLIAMSEDKFHVKKESLHER